MLRPQAVEALLFEDVARVKRGAATTDERRTELARSRRRAVLAAALDWLAIAVLFIWRDPLSEFLALGASEESVFTLAILAVATHSGFRLGQREKYGAVAAAIRSLGRFC